MSMKKVLFVLLVILNGFATEISLYHGKAYVFEKRVLEQSDGRSKITGMPKGVDPTTISFDQNVEWWYYEDGKLSYQKLLQPYLGKRISFYYEKKIRQGKLLSINPLMILGDRLYSNVTFKDIVLKPKNITYLPTLYLEKISRRWISLGYLCRGMDYRVRYIARLDNKLHLWANLQIINNTGHEFRKAKLKIVAIRDQRYIPIRALTMSTKPRKFEGVYRYELPGRWDLTEHVTIPFLQQSSDYTLTYTAVFYDAHRAFGKEERYFDQELHFRSPQALPGGNVMILRDNELVGETWMGPQSANQEIRLPFGKDFDKKIVRIQHSFIQKKNHFQSSIEYHFINPDGKPVSMEVIERLPTTNLSISGNCNFKIVDAKSVQIVYRGSAKMKSCHITFKK